MFTTLDSITQQLRAGEDGFAEFKEVRLGEHGGRIARRHKDKTGYGSP